MENNVELNKNQEEVEITKKNLLASLRIRALTFPLVFFSFLFVGGIAAEADTPKVFVLLFESFFFISIFLTWGLFLFAVIAFFSRKFNLADKFLVVSNHKLVYIGLVLPILFVLVMAVFEK